MLHNSNGEQTFLNGWDLSGDSETGARLSEIVEESVAQAKEMYGTSIYAVVSDNAAAMLKMGRMIEIWHSTCSSHIGNLLTKDVLDQNIAKNVSKILKEFRHPDLERYITDKGGWKIKTPAETRWCSQRDSFDNLIKNLQFMKEAAVNPSLKIKQDVKQLLFDDQFILNVEKFIKLFDPICALINNAQKPTCSIADSANLWLSLELPAGFEQHQDRLNYRKSMALNIHALVAYYLHPFYPKEKLSVVQKKDVEDFLLEHLDADGCEAWDLYLRKKGIFENLYNKNLNDSLLFWRLALLRNENLAKLAIKLLQIPASSAQLERVFSNWSYVHSDIRNRLSFEHSKKLVHVYHSLKIKDSSSQLEEED